MEFIKWPEGFIPGRTDNYVSNEIIRTGLKGETVWQKLTDTSAWPGYYSNVSDIHFYDNSGPFLKAGSRFRFTTFSFPVEAEVTEFEEPSTAKAGRIAWHGWVEGGADSFLNVHHAWLIEILEGDRVRILTQETQNGGPAKELASAKPNPMLNAHQEWIEGLAKAACE